MRFLSRPPATEAAGLLALPWDRPLQEWPEDVVGPRVQRPVPRQREQAGRLGGGRTDEKAHATGLRWTGVGLRSIVRASRFLERFQTGASA